MRIPKIEISNVLGMVRADIDASKPVLMVIGANEAGKSSIRDALSMALVGDPSRVKPKKKADLAQLLNSDAKKGRVSLLDGEDLIGEYLLPGGDHTAPEIPGADFVQYVINPASIAALDAKDLRAMLYSLTQCKMSPNIIEQKLVARGANPAFAEELKPILRGGPQAGQKDAAERATQAKGAWRAVTGMNWGAVQSEGWEPEAPEVEYDKEAHDKVLAAIIKTSSDIENGNQALGKLMQARIDRQQTAEKIEDLQNLAGTLQRATKKLESTQGELTKWREKLEGLLATQAQQVTGAMKCPCCSEMLVMNAGVLAKAEGEAVDHNQARELAEEIKRARESVALYERTLNNDQRDITAAENATHELGVLQQEQGEDPSENIEEYQAALAKLKTKLLTAQDNDRYWKGILAAQADLAGKKEQATKHHEEVKAWLVISEALKPDGIPAEILSTALKPVNDSLAILSRMAGWKKVHISDDMEITADGRIYGLMSESAKWRIDTLLAAMIAQVSELRFMVLDRFDVLDQKGRSELINLLLDLNENGLLDQAIICGTMKQPLTGMPAEIAQVWVNNGIAENV